jgi:hypothetical protein
MKCQFYLQLDGAPPIRLGPIEAADDSDARRLAMVEMERRPNVSAIDIWCDHGELYRVERPATAHGGSGAAWASAFRGGQPLSP